MKKLALALLVLGFLAPMAASAQQTQGGSPNLYFNTSVFKEGQETMVGRIVAKVRLAYMPEGSDDGQLCITLGIEPDPRSILKGYLSFLRSTSDEKGKEKREKIGVKLGGKPYKEDGIEFWAECAEHPVPQAGDELKIFVRRPKKEMIMIPVRYPDPGQYQWVTVTALTNGGLSWDYKTTQQEDASGG
ncbi:MAG: hypothetical protein KDD11_15305 [Acidobacteria bacterium]|nr:hypothetical protein [Acidobacteriota bacterium]